MECAEGDKKDPGYFARSNGGIFSGKNIETSALVKNPFNIGQVIFSFVVNKILRFQVTLDPLYAKNVITQLALVTNKIDCNVESITQLMIC